MEATITVICNKFKILRNGECPIMVRVAKDGKRSLKSLGVSINPVYWDFKKNCPKKNCPNRAELMKLISQTLSKYQGRAIEAKSKGEDVSVFSLIEEKNQFVCRIYVDDFLSKKFIMSQRYTFFIYLSIKSKNLAKILVCFLLYSLLLQQESIITPHQNEENSLFCDCFRLRADDDGRRRQPPMA